MGMNNATTSQVVVSVRMGTRDPITYRAWVGSVLVYIGGIDESRHDVRRMGTVAANRRYWRCMMCGCEYGRFADACPNCGSGTRMKA